MQFIVRYAHDNHTSMIDLDALHCIAIIRTHCNHSYSTSRTCLGPQRLAAGLGSHRAVSEVHGGPATGGGTRSVSRKREEQTADLVSFCQIIHGLTFSGAMGLYCNFKDLQFVT